jgi:hypothetical protein
MRRFVLGIFLLLFMVGGNLFADPTASKRPPVKLSVKVENGFIASLSWTDYIPGQKTKYNVYLSESTPPNYKKINDFPYESTGCGYGCLEKKDYSFIVKPVLKTKPLSEGPASNEVKVTMTQAHPVSTPFPSPVSMTGPYSYAIKILNKSPLHIRVRVLDMDEKPVRVVQDGILPEGKKLLFWDGRDEKGAGVPDGSYVIEIQRYTERATLLEQHRVQIPGVTK